MHSLRKAVLCYCKSTPCVVSKKNWNTKEDKGKSMMCTAVGDKAHGGIQQ